VIRRSIQFSPRVQSLAHPDELKFSYLAMRLHILPSIDTPPGALLWPSPWLSYITWSMTLVQFGTDPEATIRAGS
jgi:hypothetical protein